MLHRPGLSAAVRHLRRGNVLDGYRRPAPVMPRLGAFALALASSTAFAGCGHRAGPAESPAPAVSAQVAVPSMPDSAGAPAATVEPDSAAPGTLTCARLGAAIKQGTLMESGVVNRIAAASSTADAPVADAAQRLAAAYAAALATRGTAHEPDAIAAVSAAAADMDGVCRESGLESNG